MILLLYLRKLALSVDLHERKEIWPCEDFRNEVGMEPPQYNGGLSGLQKRGYLAKRKSRKALREKPYLIFKS